jgi:thermitase
LVKFNVGTNENTEQDVHNRRGGTVIGEVAQLGVKVVKIPAGKVKEKVGACRNEKTVAFAEPDYLVRAFRTPNDTYFPTKWGLTQIDAPNAWNVTASMSDVKIAASKNFTNSRMVDDLYGHGTHVAGIAAAVTNNAKSVAGVGYNCRIANGITWAGNNGGHRKPLRCPPLFPGADGRIRTDDPISQDVHLPFHHVMS